MVLNRMYSRKIKLGALSELLMKPILSMKTIQIFLFVLSSASLVAQHADQDEIKRLSAEFSAHYVQGNFQAMADLYTKDAILMSPGKEVIVGKSSILEFWMTNTSPSMHKSVHEKIVVDGNTAHDYGYYYVQSQKPGEESVTVFSAKYYIFWVRDESGQWKMKMDMWNSRSADWNKK